MAIFGLNFNGTHIPTTGAFRRFPKRIRRVECNHAHPGNFPTTGRGDRIGSYVCCLTCKEEREDAGGSQFVAFILQGVGQSALECNLMLTQANNGHRKLHVEKRMTAGGEWFGIYVY